MILWEKSSHQEIIILWGWEIYTFHVDEFISDFNTPPLHEWRQNRSAVVQFEWRLVEGKLTSYHEGLGTCCSHLERDWTTKVTSILAEVIETPFTVKGEVSLSSDRNGISSDSEDKLTNYTYQNPKVMNTRKGESVIFERDTLQREKQGGELG